eukprot:36947-Eustigmatos_ZCMA.PRE.1
MDGLRGASILISSDRMRNATPRWNDAVACACVRVSLCKNTHHKCSAGLNQSLIPTDTPGKCRTSTQP